MKKRLVPFNLIILAALSVSSFAQIQSSYSFQKDDTLLRKKYYDESVKKKNLLLESVGKEHASDYKKIYKDQFELIESFWKSSRPVTDPEINGYLQQMVQKIIAANNELKNIDARIVFSRDWWPNAFSAGDGTIAVNAGLFIFLENEAQLVFVLCHELAHYYLNHTQTAIKKYVETINSESYKAELKRLSKEEFRVNQQLEQLAKSMVLDSRRHSRDKEAEADRKAFEFMKNTGYDSEAIITCLQLLDKIDDSLVYSKPLVLEQVFNFSEYPFKKKWIQKESAIFSQLNENETDLSEKEKDSLKTHPDCSKRIAMLTDLPEKNKENQNLFIIDEQKFKRLKKDFYLEMTEQCYRDDNLSRNLFYSLLLLENDPGNPIAIYSVVRCLNLMYEYQKNHKLGLSIDAEGKANPAQYNLLLRMISRLRLDEIISLNTYFCRKYYTVMKDDPGFQKEVKKLGNFSNN